ncbi:hypothetical protein glysoja_000041 [Glycine soja]|nr:hypothetical protein glysoja_000041 [Glycine soja]
MVLEEAWREREADMHSPKEERLWLQPGKPASHKKGNGLHWGLYGYVLLM